MREIRKSTVMVQMVQSLRSPQVDGREQLMTRSETPAMVEATPWLTSGLNPCPAASWLCDQRQVSQPLWGSGASSAQWGYECPVWRVVVRIEWVNAQSPRAHGSHLKNVFSLQSLQKVSFQFFSVLNERYSLTCAHVLCHVVPTSLATWWCPLGGMGRGSHCGFQVICACIYPLLAHVWSAFSLLPAPQESWSPFPFMAFTITRRCGPTQRYDGCGRGDGWSP